MSKNRSLRKFMKEHREIHKIAKVIGILYGVFYYIGTGLLAFGGVKVYSQAFVEDIVSTSLTVKAPFILEPIALFEIPPFIILQISPLNLIVMLLIIYLIYKNVVIILIGLRYPRVCQLVREKGQWVALLPLLITGSVCLVLIVTNLLNGSPGAVITSIKGVLYWVMPASIMLLVYGVLRGYRSLHLHY